MARTFGTPLVEKLGVAEGMRLVVLGAPRSYGALLGPLPAGARIARRLSAAAGMVHVFATRRVALGRTLRSLRGRLETAVPVWVSWPKQASGVATDVSEDVVREIALPLGYVDVKVCAIDEVWSGLKLVVRKRLR